MITRSVSLLALLWLCVAPLAADQQGDVLALVNQFRAANGRPQLSVSAPLARAAGAYAVILATQAEFSHQIGGTTATGRDQAAGYQGGYIGENIARGFFDAASVETAWENSPGHRVNLLDANFKDIGVGWANGPFGQSWVQDFGRVSPPPIVPPPVVIPPPPITPVPVTPPPVVTLIGKFSLFKDNLGNYFLLPATP
jgi:hypothetical protein